MEDGGKWNVFSLSLFRVSFSDPWAKLEGFSWNSFWLFLIPTASVLTSGQGIPEGKEMANSPLGWWYFESWSPPLCLKLFTFQSSRRTAPCFPVQLRAPAAGQADLPKYVFGSLQLEPNCLKRARPTRMQAGGSPFYSRPWARSRRGRGEQGTRPSWGCSGHGTAPRGTPTNQSRPRS